MASPTKPSPRTSRLRRIAGPVLAVLAITCVQASPAGAAPRDGTGISVLRDQVVGIDPFGNSTAPSPSQLCGVGTEVQFEGDTTLEPSIAVNPGNPSNAVVAYIQGYNKGSCGAAQNIGYATTFDGGQTWKAGNFPIGPAANGSWALTADPIVAFGPNNQVYVTFIPEFPNSAQPAGLGLIRSSDGGATWSDVLTVDPQTPLGLPSHDTPYLVVDNGTGAGHHPGRLYAMWTSGAVPVVLAPAASYSDDGGTTWQAASPLGVSPGTDVKGVVLSDGSLGIFYDTGSKPSAPGVPYVEKYFFIRANAPSLPGEPLVFGSPVEVAEALNNPDSQQHNKLDPAAVTVNPATGVIYAAWTDGRFREDTVNDIVLSQSGDNGKTWSAPVRVNKGSLRDFVNHFHPMITITASGAVRVAYRQRRQSVELEPPSGCPTVGTNVNVDTYVQQSRDGTAFAGPVQANSIQTDIRFAAYKDTTYFLGDYSQMASGGPYTYVARAEAYSTVAGEPACWPPTETHQRIWVAVLN
ncbi:sialidase family protein [Kitasatospora sp. NPDC093558]|uniref:sialidase family protein n=1 Tax=Kitasatospora sp. NPDC093558 TaxID=3155201 RepID=UPI00342F8983